MWTRTHPALPPVYHNTPEPQLDMDQLNLTDECLCRAARRNDLKTLNKLIAAKQFEPCVADLSINITEKPLHHVSWYPCNKEFEHRDTVNELSCLNRALHYRCDDYNRTGDTDSVSLLLDAGAEVNVQDLHDNTPVSKAAGEDYMGIAKLLVSRGADVTNYRYILDEPIARGYDEVVQFLLKQGVVPTASDVSSAFDNMNIIRMIFRKNPDVVKEWDGLYRIMERMLKTSSYDVLELLLELGVDPNTPHPKKPLRYILHVAASYGNKQAMKKLLTVGAKVNLDDKAELAVRGATETAHYVRKQLEAAGIPAENVVEWRSPLFVATKHFRDLEKLSQVLEAGANVLTVTRKGRLPLHVASPDTMAVHLLACEPYNCPLDVKDLDGMTPLLIDVSKKEWTEYCPSFSQENVCVMLLQHGAVYEPDPAGRSFLYHMARHHKLKPNICQAVVYSGNDLRVVLQDIQELQEMAGKEVDTSGHQWLDDFLTNAESLKMMSVRAIRSQLRKARPGLSIWGSMFRLPLPAPVVQLLTLNHLQPHFGPWKLYSSVHPHVLREYCSLHPED